MRGAAESTAGGWQHGCQVVHFRPAINIVRWEICSRDTIKYSLSNAPADTGIKKLAQMQGQRFWIERAFEDAKSHTAVTRTVVNTFS